MIRDKDFTDSNRHDEICALVLQCWGTIVLQTAPELEAFDPSAFTVSVEYEVAKHFVDVYIESPPGAPRSLGWIIEVKTNAEQGASAGRVIRQLRSYGILLNDVRPLVQFAACAVHESPPSDAALALYRNAGVLAFSVDPLGGLVRH